MVSIQGFLFGPQADLERISLSSSPPSVVSLKLKDPVTMGIVLATQIATLVVSIHSAWLCRRTPLERCCHVLLWLPPGKWECGSKISSRIKKSQIRVKSKLKQDQENLTLHCFLSDL